ncbi:MAG: Phosphate-specific transport system accessory protein PhoU [Eubacterium sp.]
MREVYNEELKTIKNEILLMSSQAERMLSDSITALEEQNVKLARSVISRDDIVDLKEIQLQQIVSEVIARQQPVAGDLRRLSSTYKIITNLERIADLAVNICQKVICLRKEEYYKKLDNIPQMAKMVEDQLKMCIQAYIDEDISKMDDVIRYEDEIDRLNNTLHSDCIAEINQNPEMALQAMSFSFIGSHLERIGDHATNIFETVYFIVTGNYMDFNDLNTIQEDE